MRRFALIALGLLLGMTSLKCGMMVDTDRIVVARMDGEPIRRGDLNRIIRAMTDEERPIIQNRGDLLRTLNRHIDGLIKGELGRRLREEGKIQIPREQAEAVYFERHPEYRSIRAMKDPESLGYSPKEFEAFKQQVEYEIDDIESSLYADASILYAAAEAFQSGTLVVGDEEYQAEYNLRKEGIISLERISFSAFRFLAAMPDAGERAATVRRRLDDGEYFETLVEEFRASNPDSLLPNSVMENNPAVPKFANAWVTLHGAEVGRIYGPLFLPEYDLQAQLTDGSTQVQTFPAAFLVLRVESHTPAQVQTLEAAKPSLLPFILVGKMMKRLREERGAEVFPDKLPNPAGYGDQFSEYIIE